MVRIVCTFRLIEKSPLFETGAFTLLGQRCFQYVLNSLRTKRSCPEEKNTGGKVKYSSGFQAQVSEVNIQLFQAVTSSGEDKCSLEQHPVSCD